MNPFMHLLSLGLEEFRKQWQMLLKTHHPDRGGDTRTMQYLNEVKEMFATGKVKAARKERTERENAPGFKGQKTSYAKASEWDAKLREAILKILDLEDISIELIGTWLWVEGNVKAHDKFLKENGFKYQFKGGVERYYYGSFVGKRGFGRVPQDRIKARYGTKQFEKEGALVKG